MDAWSGSDLVVYRQRTSASTSSLPLGHDAPASDARRRIDGAAIRTRRTLPTHRHAALLGDPARPASGRLPGTGVHVQRAEGYGFIRNGRLHRQPFGTWDMF